MCMYISMSCYCSKYEFLGPDSAGVRGGEVQFEESMHAYPPGMRIVRARITISALTFERARDGRDARPRT